MVKANGKGSSDQGDGTKSNGKRRKITKESEEQVSLLLHKVVTEEDDERIDSHDVAHDSDLHSSMKAKLLFEWMIYPMKSDEFYAKYWEKRPLVIKRACGSYYDGWFDVTEMGRILDEHTLEYGKEIDLTKYIDETRHTLNPVGTATRKQVQKLFDDGCSVRLLCPQKFSDALWLLLSILEEEFGCMVGANTYWTPKRTQGFAPHYDDIEAFLLQVNGTKHWKVYAPLDENSTLPRFSSENFAQDAIGKPILEVDLDQGDLLYLPRGFIHQAQASDQHDSLHMTVSAGQQNSIGNFLELLVPEALGAAIATNVDLRKSLPRDYYNYMGVMHSDLDESFEPRKAFYENVKKALRQVMAEAMARLDAGCDQMVRNFLVDRLPPCLEEEEENCSVEQSPLLKITVNTQFRLLRAHIARLVVEDGKAVVYHCRENSRLPHETPLSPLEFELDDAESIEFIFKSYPEFFRVGDLPHEDMDDQIGVVKALYDEGLLVYQRAE